MHAVQDQREYWADEFMLYWTQFGEAVTANVLFFLLWLSYRKQPAWKRVRKGFLFTVFLAVIIPQGLKLIFADFPRPWTVFPDAQNIPGLTKSFYKSFPSGHTAFATALAASWSSLALNKYQYPILMALIAFGVGYSRIHLHMHWLHDVIAGGLLGILCAYFGLKRAGYSQTS